MRVRAGCILIEDGRLALMERHRAGLHYFTFPGGGVDEGETHEQAAVREMEEELGIQVRIVRKVADVHFDGKLQVYFLVEKTGGEFGSGTGEEYGEFDPAHGTYRPIWMPLEEVAGNNVLPHELAELVARSQEHGWAEEPAVIYDKKA